jgi:hypothetical protein
MTLQRFQNFQIGALDAQRLNQMVDAIMRLEQRVAQMAQPYEPTRDVILAIITGPGIKASQDREDCIPCVSYPFEEVGLAIADTGKIGSATCVSTQRIEGGLSNANGAFLITFESTPALTPGTVVKAHLGSRASSGTAEDKGMVYVATPLIDGAIYNGVVTAVLEEEGKYEVGMEGSAESVIVEVENIYETSGYYGVYDDPQNECAELVARRLRVGDLVPVWRHMDRHYTMAPTPFTVVCQPCDTDAIAQAMQAPDPIGKDFIAYAMLKR